MAGANETSGTTSAASVLVVTLTQWHQRIEVFSEGADNLWVRTDRVNPVKGGDDTEFIPANQSRIIGNLSQPPDQGAGQYNTTEVRIYCDTAIPFTVAGR